MLSRRKPLRITIVTGMILLAIFASLPATSCYCADGHLKLFCGGHYAGSPSPTAKASPDCCQCDHDADEAANHGSDCCHGKDSSQPGGNRCQEISKSLTTTVASISLPALDSHVFAVLPAEVVVHHAFPSLRNAQLERIESGPPVDLVIALHTLLI